MGSIISDYESVFARQVGRGKTVAFRSGTDALTALLRALVSPSGADNDTVVITPFTCLSVPRAVMAAGLTPVYADINLETLTLDPLAVERILTPRTRAVVFQHTFGISTGIEAVVRLAKERGLALIEDCAHVFPGNRHGKDVAGTFGDASFFSLGLMKPLSWQAGGVAWVPDEALANGVREVRKMNGRSWLENWWGSLRYTLYRNFYRPRFYWAAARAFGTIDEKATPPLPVTVSLGVTAVEARRFINNVNTLETLRASALDRCRRYHADVPSQAHIFAGPPDMPLYAYPVRVADKAAVLGRARELGAEIYDWPGASVIYPLREPAALERWGYRSGAAPDAEKTAAQTLALPTHQKILDGDHDRILKALKAGL